MDGEDVEQLKIRLAVDACTETVSASVETELDEVVARLGDEEVLKG